MLNDKTVPKEDEGIALGDDPIGQTLRALLLPDDHSAAEC
mgnify:CR=1 FL=1